MELNPLDLAAIPVHRLAIRGLHLGPFGSGQDLVKFLGVAVFGAVVAAVSSAVLWVPFLALGAIIAFVRVEGRTLDDYALGYFRFRWRTKHASGRPVPSSTVSPPARGGTRQRRPSIRAEGVPIAYLPPADLQHLYDEWRAALRALDRPLGYRMRGERFSPLPFIPTISGLDAGESAALASYRDLVRAVLRHRYRRVVDLTVWNDPSDRRPKSGHLEAAVTELITALERLGVPAYRALPDDRNPVPLGGWRS